MKELVIQVPESEYAFVTKLLQQLRFVNIKEDNTNAKDTVLTATKTSYLFSPEAFDELYDIAMEDNVIATDILEEFEKNKIVETL